MSNIQDSLLYARDIRIAFWSFEVVVILIILIVEIRTFYRSLFPRQKNIMHHAQAPSGSSQSTPPTDTKPSSDVSFDNPNDSKPKLIFIIPILSYICYIISGIVGVLFMLNYFGPCQYGALIGSAFYGFGKMWMYIVFIYKLNIVYSDSFFEYNKKILGSIVIFVVTYTIIMVIINCITADVFETYENGIRVCRFNVILPVLACITMVDLILSGLSCYLFVRPLLLLNRHLDTANDSLRSDLNEMQKVVFKYTILTFTAVASTFVILIIMGVLELTFLVSIDIVINCFCIMFFNKAYNSCFEILCCGAIKIFSKVTK